MREEAGSREQDGGDREFGRERELVETCTLTYHFLLTFLHYSRAWSSLPGLKRTARPGVMSTFLPVRGLRPTPVLRGLTVKTPKPRSSMRSP